MRVGAEQAAHRQGKTREREFFETVVFWKSARRTHCGNGAQRGERGLGWGCRRKDIMVNGSVQRVRSKREFQYGRGDKLANRVRASEARRLVAAMREIELGPTSVGRAVAARASAWISKTG